MSRSLIVLAAGEGKRMRSSLPKVLHPLLGRTMLDHVLAAPEERAVGGINAGAYVFEVGVLREALDKLSTDNDQGEESLTDVFGTLLAAGHAVTTATADDPVEALGANDRAQLATLRALLR